MATIPPSEPASYTADPDRIKAYADRILAALPSPDVEGDMIPGFALAATLMLWAATDVGHNRVPAMHAAAKSFHDLVAAYHSDLLRGHFKAGREAGEAKPPRRERRAAAAKDRKGKS